MNPHVANNSLLDSGRLEFLQRKALEVAPLEGDLCEIGVYKGGSALLLCETVGPLGHVYLIDTFCGLPDECEHDNHHKRGDFNDTSVRHVEMLLKDYNNYTLLTQVFPTDTRALDGRRFKLVHIDADLYQSYKDCLDYFYPRMVTGGYIVLDDYGASSCNGAKKATDEFVARHGLMLHQGSSCQYYLKT